MKRKVYIGGITFLRFTCANVEDKEKKSFAGESSLSLVYRAGINFNLPLRAVDLVRQFGRIPRKIQTDFLYIPKYQYPGLFVSPFIDALEGLIGLYYR